MPPHDLVLTHQALADELGKVREIVTRLLKPLNGNIGIWGWLGAVPPATGAIGRCPPCAMLGFITCSMKNKI